MKIRSAAFALASILAVTTTTLAQKGLQPATVEKKVEPEYPPDLKSFVTDIAKVEVVIDPEGIPFSLNSQTPLPDNVVQALSRWRFHPARQDGSAVAVRSSLVVPIHRPIERADNFARTWRRSKAVDEAFAAAKQMDDASAAKMEQELAKAPDNEAAHEKLLARSVQNPGPASDDVRLRELLWLVRNNPRSDFLALPLAIPPDPDTQSAGAIAARQSSEIRKLWLDTLAANRSDDAILIHATNFLRFAAPPLAEQALLSQINETGQAAVLLGDLYGVASVGVRKIDPTTGSVMAFSSGTGEALPNNDFALKSRSVLMQTENPRVLFAGLHVVSAAARSTAAKDGLPAGYAEFCDGLLERAKVFYPATTASCDTSSGPVPPNAGVAGDTTQLRIGGPVQQAKLIKQEVPRYPTEAKSRRITGKVQFLAVISKDGTIRDLELISGPLALYKSARDAVSKWEYNPTKLNGQPVEVITTIDVNYALN